MSNGGSINVADILDLHTFSSGCDWSFSPDGAMLALTVGRPLSKSVQHTNAAGGQPEEREIWLVDLTSSATCLSQPMPGPPGQIAFAPSWSPDGRYLAFVRAEPADELGHFGTRMPLWRAFVSVWDCNNGVTLDLAPVVLDAGGGHTPEFFWLDDRHVRCLHSAGHEKRFSGLWQESEATLGARLAGLDTAEIFDTATTAALAKGTQLLSIFEIGVEPYPVMQLATTKAEDVSIGLSWAGLMRGGALMKRPDCRLERYWPERADVGPSDSEPVETGALQVAMDRIARDPDTGRIWALWHNEVTRKIALLTLAPGASAFRPLGARRFSAASAPHLCVDGTVLFSATEEGKGAAEWFAAPPGAGEDGAAEVIALKKLGAPAAEAILELPGHVFLERPGPARRLSWSHSGVPEIVHLPAPLPSIGAPIWPHPTRPEVAVVAAEVSLFRAASPGGPGLWSTRNGWEFSPLKVPETAQIKAVWTGTPDTHLAALMHDSDGSHVLLCSEKPPRLLASFNRAVARKSRAQMLFLPHSNPRASVGPTRPIHSALLLPPVSPPASGYPILAHIYPHASYPPDTFPYAHAALVPHAHNPYLVAAAGFGVLHVAMPLHEEVIARGAEALFEAAEQNLEIALDLAEAHGVDRDRVALMGHSWGAAMALNLLERYPRLRGAIVSAGLYNPLGWHGCFENREALSLLEAPDATSAQMAMQSCFASAPPSHGPEAYLVSAPLLRARNQTRPVLIMHGTRDFVPVAQAEQMFSALRTSPAGVRLVRFAGEGHIVSAPGNIMRFHHEIHMFLDKVLHAGGA